MLRERQDQLGSDPSIAEVRLLTKFRKVGGRVKSRLRRLYRGLRVGPVVLMYHRVADESFDPWGLAVRADRFAEQMAWLESNRIVLPLAEFAALHARRQLPSRAVALTFDDGYECNLATAAPLMKKHDLPATIFICPTLIERGEECWWDDLERIVLHANVDVLTLRAGKLEHRVELGSKSDADRIWAPDAPPQTARQRAFMDLWSQLRELEPDIQSAAIADLRAQAGTAREPRPTHRLMTAQTVVEAERWGIAIGGHTLTHVALSYRNPAEQTAEIAGSRVRCAELIGKLPDCFAYPYGDLNDDSPSIVEQAGFLCGCTTESARTRPADSAYRLPRVQAGNWTARELARALKRV